MEILLLKEEIGKAMQQKQEMLQALGYDCGNMGVGKQILGVWKCIILWEESVAFILQGII